MKMSWTGNPVLKIAAGVLAVLVLCRAFRLLNGVLWRIGRIGILIALVAVAYGLFRSRSEG